MTKATEPSEVPVSTRVVHVLRPWQTGGRPGYPLYETTDPELLDAVVTSVSGDTSM